MKRLLFLLPLILLALNVTHVSLYKPSVNYSPNGQLYHLTPASWRQKSIKIAAPQNPYMQSGPLMGNGGMAPSSEPLSHNAKFNGFPLGFYFSNHLSNDNSFVGQSVTITAYSWLWAIIDGLIVVAALALALVYNRSRKMTQFGTETKVIHPQRKHRLRRHKLKKSSADSPTISGSK
jgi:hypothetical protein